MQIDNAPIIIGFRDIAVQFYGTVEIIDSPLVILPLSI
jgi:hypothetical protein